MFFSVSAMRAITYMIGAMQMLVTQLHSLLQLLHLPHFYLLRFLPFHSYQAMLLRAPFHKKLRARPYLQSWACGIMLLPYPMLEPAFDNNRFFL